MNRKLNKIASIRTGVFLKPSDNGDVFYIQPKYYDKDGELITSLDKDVSSIQISDKHLLKKGDVLFAAKGIRNFATVIDLDDQYAVASTSFFVIRSYGDVIPDYIQWFLNQSPTLKKLKRQAKGSAIASISKQTLAGIQIQVPTIEKQNLIVNLSKLRKEEKRLLDQLAIKKDQMINANIFNSLKSN